MLDFFKFKDKELKAIGFGEVLFDTFVDKKVLGGAPCNFCYHMKQNGIDSTLISAIGRDADGDDASYQIATKGIIALLQRVDAKTAFVNITLDKDGIANYTFSKDSSYDYIHYDKYVDLIANNANIICFGSLALREKETKDCVFKILDKLNEKDSIKIFDINIRQNFYSKELILECLKYTDVFKCNEDELALLIPMLCPKAQDEHDFYNYLKTKGISIFIFTKGSINSTIFYKDMISIKESLKVEIKDTVGAGDSFTACFIASMLKGYSLEEAHIRANKLAAFICTKDGATPPYDINNCIS